MTEQGGRTVVGVDGSELSKLALEWTLDHAAPHDTVQLIVAWHYPVMYGSAGAVSDWNPETDARRIGEEALNAARARRADMACELVVVSGGPAEVLTDASKDAQMLVVGAKGHNAMSRLFIGSTSSQVISHASCTVVVVR